MTKQDWRLRIGEKTPKYELGWRAELYKEAMDFVDKSLTLARLYNWNFWGGGTRNYAVTLFQNIRDGKYISIRIIPMKGYSYYASFVEEGKPNNIEINQYNTYIGTTLEEAMEYLRNFLSENQYVIDPNRHELIQYKGNGYDKWFLNILWMKEAMERHN